MLTKKSASKSGDCYGQVTLLPEPGEVLPEPRYRSFGDIIPNDHDDDEVQPPPATKSFKPTENSTTDTVDYATQIDWLLSAFFF